MTLPLADALAQCERHAGVLRSAMVEMPSAYDVPLLLAADPTLIRVTDQFVLRFIKLQDTLGEHVLRPFAAEVLGEPVSDLPLVDVVERLDRFGMLSSAGWFRWRALRNALTHDYPDQPEIRSAVLNEALGAARGMLELLLRLREAAARRPR
jgi:hypothetical protein